MHHSLLESEQRCGMLAVGLNLNVQQALPPVRMICMIAYLLCCKLQCACKEMHILHRTS
jgi:hypothetical protein